MNSKGILGKHGGLLFQDPRLVKAVPFFRIIYMAPSSVCLFRWHTSLPVYDGLWSDFSHDYGRLGFEQKKVGLVFVKLENRSEMHPMKCSREFNKRYIYDLYE